MDINSTKFLPREAGASKVPAAARFLSSPVCLPSRTAEGRGQRRRGLSVGVAFWEVESFESFFNFRNGQIQLLPTIFAI